MKKKFLLVAGTFLLLIALLIFQSQAIILGAAVIMATISFIVLKFMGSGHYFMNITRWARENPVKTRVIITGLILVIICLGVWVGFDLYQLGYVFREITAMVFGGLMILGFLSVPFNKVRPIFTLPSVIFRDRLLYTGILICVFGLSVYIGNSAEEKYPGSAFLQLLERVDEEILAYHFADEEYPQGDSEASDFHGIKKASTISLFPLMALLEKSKIDPTVVKGGSKTMKKATEKLKKIERKMNKRLMKIRELYAAGASAGTVLLYILLSLLVCTGICLIIGGFSGGGVGYGILGIVVLAGAIYGIVLTSKENKKKQEIIEKGSP